MLNLLSKALCLLLIVFSVNHAENIFAGEKVKIRDITLSVPKEWKQKPPSNRLRLAQFDVPAAEEGADPAELVVYSFGGDGGEISANITRWIGQFKKEGRQVKLTEGSSDQGKYVLVDIRGTYKQPIGPPILRKTKLVKDARMLAVILQVDGKGNYFLKMAGNEKTVSKQAKALRDSYGADADNEKEYKLPEV